MTYFETLYPNVEQITIKCATDFLLRVAQSATLNKKSGNKKSGIYFSAKHRYS